MSRILYVILLFICVFVIIIFAYKMKKQQQQIEQLHSEIVEVQSNLDGYVDNYIALWTTINNMVSTDK